MPPMRIPVKKEDFDDGIKQIAAGGLADMFQTGDPSCFTVGELSDEEPIAFSEDGGTVFITVKDFQTTAGVATEPAATVTKPRKRKAATADAAPAIAPAPSGDPKIYRGGKGRPPAWWAKMGPKMREHYMAADSTDARKLAYMKKFGAA